MALSLLPMAVAAFLPGHFPEAAVFITFAVVFSAVFAGLFALPGVELSAAGIANGPVLLPWQALIRIEVTDGRFFRRVRIIRADRRIALAGPWTLRTVFRTGYAEFDAGVAELRRWAEAYAPEAEVVVRRRGPDWLGDLLAMLLNCVAILIPVIGLDVMR